MRSSFLFFICSFYITFHLFSFSSASSWVQFPLINGPTGRLYAASSGGAPVPPPYDPSDRSGIVVFGGTNNAATFSECLNDLWILNPQDWTHTDNNVWTLIPLQTASPPPRALAAIAVDPGTNILVLTGGYNGSSWFNDVWIIDLSVVQYPPQASSWVELTATPFKGGPRCGLSMTFFGRSYPTNLEFLVFGGGADKRQLYNDAYAFTHETVNGFGWRQFDTPNQDWPTAREFHTATLVENNQIFIFGGYDYGFTYFNDSWLITAVGSGLQVSAAEVGTEAPPPGRCCNALAWSPKSQALLIWGGRNGDSSASMYDMWKLDYENMDAWYSVLSYNTSYYYPPGRYGMVSGWYEQEDALILWGGADGDGNLFEDIWYYPFADA